MTNSLFNAMNEETARTANGAKTLESSLNKCVDFFSVAGASRGKDIKSLFIGAYGENKEVAVRTLLWLRDVRGGAGERETFRQLYTSLNDMDKVLSQGVLNLVPELGRWDDLFIAFGTQHETHALRMITKALKYENALVAKWLPRKGKVANKIRSYLKLTPKQYRKMLVALSKTVEQKMCSNQWNAINYSHVPSLASARYQKAFFKHDENGYGNYIEALKSGDPSVKINTGAVYPYDVTKSLNNGNVDVANAQWKALPNYMEDTDERIMPLVDVSGSMGCIVGGVKSNLRCIEVAISLGLYLAERNEGIFKDQFMTFSNNPQLVKLTGDSLYQRYNQLNRANWDMSTDIQKAFYTLLMSAQKHNVLEEEMPTKILILSDMEFNSSYVRGKDVTAFDGMQRMYEDAGYKIPQIVFWNLNGRAGNSPVKSHDTGTAMISGFSPAILSSVLGAKQLNPYDVMMETVMKDRYKL